LRRVIFDSSFLMAVAEHPTTCFEDMVEMLGRFEPVILDCVKNELKQLSSGRGKKARLAVLALELAGDFSVEPCGRASVDDEVASAALNYNAIVATMDNELASTLKTLGVRVVCLRFGRTTFT
jgi:rRNA-processing protein FCF1